jgi:hypothetical protein
LNEETNQIYNMHSSHSDSPEISNIQLPIQKLKLKGFKSRSVILPINTNLPKSLPQTGGHTPNDVQTPNDATNYLSPFSESLTNSPEVGSTRHIGRSLSSIPHTASMQSYDSDASSLDTGPEIHENYAENCEQPSNIAASLTLSSCDSNEQPSISQPPNIPHLSLDGMLPNVHILNRPRQLTTPINDHKERSSPLHTNNKAIGNNHPSIMKSRIMPINMRKISEIGTTVSESSENVNPNYIPSERNSNESIATPTSVLKNGGQIASKSNSLHRKKLMRNQSSPLTISKDDLVQSHSSSISINNGRKLSRNFFDLPLNLPETDLIWWESKNEVFRLIESNLYYSFLKSKEFKEWRDGNRGRRESRKLSSTAYVSRMQTFANRSTFRGADSFSLKDEKKEEDPED